MPCIAHHKTVLFFQVQLGHYQIQLVHHRRIALSLACLRFCFEKTANYFLFACLATHGVVANAVACHVHPHIGGRLVGRSTQNLGENGVEHGENFHVPVVVYGRLAVRLHVPRVYHVDVVEVGGCRFVGNVYGVV